MPLAVVTVGAVASVRARPPSDHPMNRGVCARGEGQREGQREGQERRTAWTHRVSSEKVCQYTPSLTLTLRDGGEAETTNSPPIGEELVVPSDRS